MTISRLPRRVLRFGISGVLVTALHVGLAVALITTVAAPPPTANGIAFLAATAFSYVINTSWSFSKPLHGQNFVRFVIVAAIGGGLAVMLSAMAHRLGLQYMVGIALVVLVVPPTTFLLHNFWTYREVSDESP